MMNSHPDQKSPEATTKPEPRRCIYCGQFAELVWVHGHGQCAACGTNTEECCRGESCAFGQ